MFDPVLVALSPLDVVAVAMEKKWGAGVLPQLVGSESRLKFERAKERLDEAIVSNDYDTIKARAEVLIKGWKALDEEAFQAGHDQDNIEVYSGSCDEVVYIFTKDRLTAQRYVAKHPEHASATLTFDEVASLLCSFSIVKIHKPMVANDKFYGTLGEILDDELPF